MVSRRGEHPLLGGHSKYIAIVSIAIVSIAIVSIAVVSIAIASVSIASVATVSIAIVSTRCSVASDAGLRSLARSPLSSSAVPRRMRAACIVGAGTWL